MHWLFGKTKEEMEEEDYDSVIAEVDLSHIPDSRKQERQFMVWVLIGMAGGKCQVCGTGEKKLEFHHQDMRKRKSSEYVWRGGRMVSDKTFWKEIVPEATNDCILVCRKCHKGIHKRNK